MPHLSIDIILFSVFLALNLVIGLLAGRHVKTIQDFAIGNKNFSTATITATIVATWIGGGFMFYALQNVYIHGLQFLIVLLGGTLCLLFTGQVLAVRMGEFLNNLSVAEAMRDLYGPVVRVITAISGIAGKIGYMAVQFQVIGKMLTILLGLKDPEVTITAATIVIIYSAFGGIRSVTITDIFQFIAFSIFIPILALLVWNHLKKPELVIDTLTNQPSFSLQKALKWDKQFLSALGLMLYFAIPGLSPSIFQRISIAKDVLQVKRSFTYAAVIHLSVMVSVSFIAVLLFTDSPLLDASSLVNYMIAKYAYPSLKGLIAVGITAMAMSTADSDLNASAVLTINDIMKPLRPKWSITIIKLRLATVFIGLCALVLALHTTNILKLILLSGSFYMPIVTVPLLLAIFGFRSGRRAVLIGMCAGFITVAFWDKFLGHTGINNVIPGMLANLIFLMGSHYMLKEDGGWTGIKEKGPLLAARQARRDWWVNLMHTLKNTKIYDYLQQNLPAYDVVYSLFGVYVLGSTYFCFFTIPETTVIHYQKLYDIAAHSVLIATAGFLTYPAWPPTFRAKWFITFAWPAGICYILFVVGTQLVIMSEFHGVQVMILLLNLVLTAFFLSGPLAFILAIIGMLAGYLIFILQYGPISMAGVTESIQFKFIYGLLIASALLMALFKSKKQKNRVEAQKASITQAYGETKNELAQIIRYSEEILKEIDEHQYIFDEPSIAYFRQALYHIKDYIRLEVSAVSIDELLLEVKNAVGLKDFDPTPQLITEKHTTASTIYIDSGKVKTLLLNSVEALQQHNVGNKLIRIVIEDATIGHHIGYMKGYTKEVGALRIVLTTLSTLPAMQEIYIFSHNPSAIETGKQPESDIFLENARIIDAHYGYLALEKDTHVYVIPINVREVRGKVMELLREPAAADPAELAHPLAIRLEKELLEKLKNTKINLEVVLKALDTIKRYHAGVQRKSGEPFFTHPITVGLILLEYCQDQDSLIAALLHDTVEDTSLSILHIKAMFGESVAYIVGKVTNVEDRMRRVSLGDHENIHRLLDYAEDERAAYVKLADRLHNMRTIQGHASLAKQKAISSETLGFFVPMAKSLGLTSVAEELKQRSLEVLGRQG